jgi:GNAT superfamily N-acetyltransferase
MYAIAPIDPAAAMSFEGLAPFEVRPVLYDLAALPRVHAVGATLFGQPVGLALAVRGWSEPGELGGAAPEARSARLLCLAVARPYRRLGAGRALLHAVEVALVAHGVQSLACNYAIASEDGLAALESFLGATGWSAPEMTMLQCRAAHAILEAPMVREQLALPPEYEIVDWVELGERDRAHIAAHRGRELWFDAALDPFHFEPDLEPLNSLALRYHGEVVGWLITRRTGPTTMYYRCLFVRTDLAKLGRGLALICEAIRRHHVLVGDRPGFGEWSTPSSLPAMVRFTKRHLAPYGLRIIEQRVVRKQFASTGKTPIAGARAARRAVTRALLLSRDECETVLAGVRAAREHWIPRADPTAFHTLGAVARLDGFESAKQYTRAAARMNPVLSGKFGWLYDRVCVVLSDALSAAVQRRARWALPAFHVLSPTRGAHLPLAPVHCDIEHRYIEPGVAYNERPVAFSVCVSAVDGRAGLNVWDLGYDETVGLDTEETARLLDAVPKQLHPFAQGELLLRSADAFHQNTPLSDSSDGAERVTLEGHAVFVGGSWLVYG